VLPFALSDTGWTAVAGLGGAAIGALVGATTGGIVDWVLSGNREKRLARAGARLVAGDIAMGASQIEGAEKDKKWWLYFEFQSANWEEYAGMLASQLSNKEFEAVSQGVSVLKLLFLAVPAGPNWPKGAGCVDLNPKQVEGLVGVQKDAAAAYNALAGLAGHEKTGDRIHAKPAGNASGSGGARRSSATSPDR
jgi:hypothetical protein